MIKKIWHFIQELYRWRFRAWRLSLRKKRLRINSLDSGYCEPPQLLLHASFQVLMEFMDEKPFELLDWSDKPKVKESIEQLVHWWIGKRPFRHLDRVWNDIKYPDDYLFIDERGYGHFNDEKYPWVKELHYQANKQEQEWEDEDDEMLRRLINVRRYLWT